MRTTPVLIALVLVVATVGLARAPQLEVTAPLSLPGHERVSDLPGYGTTGTLAVGYSDEQYANVRLPVRNLGSVPVTVTAVEPFPELLGMLETLHGDGLPITLGPGEEVALTVRVRFTNCEYYTERAVNRFPGARFEVERLGIARTVEVAYPREVVLRSPTILGCPDRSTDRSARQRMLARDE